VLSEANDSSPSTCRCLSSEGSAFLPS
jgi:hypothetical protein